MRQLHRHIQYTLSVLSEIVNNIFYDLSKQMHLSSVPVFSGVRVNRYLVSYVCFVDRCFSFCSFSFGHCLSVLLRYTNSDYPFVIFKLFMQYMKAIRGSLFDLFLSHSLPCEPYISKYSCMKNTPLLTRITCY